MTTRSAGDLDLIFREKHKDYKSSPGRPRAILRLRLGGTTSVPLDALTDEEFRDELASATGARERRLARAAETRARKAAA